MKHQLITVIAVFALALGGANAFAKGTGLPKAWKIGTEADLPKGTVRGGDACTKVTAVAHDLDAPYIDSMIPHDKPMSGRDRMSGGGQYADPKELKSWVEFRLRETCGTKKLWAQMWAKTGLGKNYSYAMVLKCPGWTMKQKYLMPAAAGAAMTPQNTLSLDVYNYTLAPKSIEVRLWDANDIQGQGIGTGVCPK